MLKSKNIIWAAVFLTLVWLMPHSNLAASTLVGDNGGATLNLQPAGGLYSPDENFTVSIYVNTNGQNVVVVAAYLSYDKNNFQAVSIDFSGSDFTNTFENVIDPINGKIKITQAKPSPGINSARGLVARVNFKAINSVAPASDNFIFDFTPGSTVDSNIVLDDGKGTDIISGVYNEKFGIDETGSPSNSTTTPSDTTAPVISNGSPAGSLSADTSQTTLSVNTDEPALCRYSTTANVAYSSMTEIISAAAMTNHLKTLNSLANGQSYSYYIKCSDASGNINTSDYLVSFSVANPLISAGGVGGGGGVSNYNSGDSNSGVGGDSNIYVLPITSTSTNKSSDSATSTLNIYASSSVIDLTDKNQEAVVKDEIITTEQRIIYSLFGLAKEEIEKLSLSEAETIFNSNHFVPLNQFNTQLYHKTMANNNLPNQAKFAVAYFLQYGTDSTKRLGPGERAGTLDSYKTAYNKIPQSINDWQDVIKIANGRWPAEYNGTAESRAQIAFAKVYRRLANQSDNKDVNAVKITAYGLRPVYRNLESEKNAIEIFGLNYRNAPLGSIDWNLVRTIAYSGIKK